MLKFPKNIQVSLEESPERTANSLDIFHTIEAIALYFLPKLEEYVTLRPLFDQHYGPLDDFLDPSQIKTICTTADYLFTSKELYPLPKDPESLAPCLVLYKNEMVNWLDDLIAKHLQSLESIQAADKLDELPKHATCPCQRCNSDYRNKSRDLNYKFFTDLVDEKESGMLELIAKSPEIAGLSDAFYQMQKSIDGQFYKIRNKMRRGSLSKLETQVRSYVKFKFSPSSTIGLQYIAKLKLLFQQFLLKSHFPITLVNDNEMDRFFGLLGPNIWRNESYLEKEFKKLIDSVLSLKTQSISSTILQEYLGNFWAHSDARRFKRQIIYHMGPTNSGKTYHAIRALCKAKTGCYLAPLRLLAGELYDTMTDEGVPTTLLTGEEVIEHPHSTHYSSTIEMAKLAMEFETAVIDEIQMIADPQRGWAWTRALVGLMAPTVHVCGDGSVLDLIQNIVEKTGDVLTVQHYERLTELNCLDKAITLTSMRKGDALIVFSRRNALKFKSDLEKLGFKVSIIYGRLGPEVRREQARKFDVGETDIIVSTDAIAMGMNLPIKRIVFSTLTKHIDNKEKKISDSEIKQIAGRAGRYKRFPVGEVTCLTKVPNGPELIQKSFYAPLVQNNKAMVGPDLEIFEQVNNALKEHNLPGLDLSEFLRLFNTMDFKVPFYCVDLTEMIELAEMVERANEKYNALDAHEIFGFACAPVNMGIMDHVQYYVYILNNYIKSIAINNEDINFESDNIDYLETSIKCVELYQWLARHFRKKNFEFDENQLLHNKSLAIERLNTLLSDKIMPTCNSCGVSLPEDAEFTLCQDCFTTGKFRRKNRKMDHLKKGPNSSSASGAKRHGKKRPPPHSKRQS